MDFFWIVVISVSALVLIPALLIGGMALGFVAVCKWIESWGK